MMPTHPKQLERTGTRALEGIPAVLVPRDLKRSGQLEAALTDAAQRTQREMAQLEGAGFYAHEAWEIVRESYLFPPEEGKAWVHGDSPLYKP